MPALTCGLPIGISLATAAALKASSAAAARVTERILLVLFFNVSSALEAADVLLRVELDADLLDQLQLGFEKIDVMFLVFREILEEELADAVVDAVAISGGVEVERPRIDFRGEIAVQDFLDVLADAQRIERLHVGEAVEKQDAIDEAIGVLHFLDAFLAPDFCEVLVSPIVEQPVMEPILVDGGQLAAQAAIEIFNDLRVTLHAWLSSGVSRLVFHHG